jgi:hypothetical protein
MPKLFLALLVLLCLETQAQDLPEQVIRLKQRPILVFHGVLASCKDEKYGETQNRPHVICFETGEYAETEESFDYLTKNSCKRLERMVKKHPKHFENGFYVMASSQGGLIARYLLHTCPVFKAKLKRLVTKGTPHLGGVDSPHVHTEKMSLAKSTVFWLYMMKLFKKLILSDISEAERCSLKDMLGKKLGSAKAIKELAVHSAKSKHRDILNLELMVNVIHSDEDIVLPPKSTVFGANYDPQTDILQPFDETPAYRINYLGLRTMYKTGRMMNCVAHGPHSQVPDVVEDDHLYELLNDNCIFDPKYYDYIPDHELYRHCLALKIMKSPKTKVLQCDPSRLGFSHNKKFMRRVAGIKVEERIIA